MPKARSVVGTSAATLPPPREPEWRKALEFMVEILTGTLVFVVVAGAAALLNLAVGYLDHIGIDGVVRFGLRTAEYALFAVDLGLYLRFLWNLVTRK